MAPRDLSNKRVPRRISGECRKSRWSKCIDDYEGTTGLTVSGFGYTRFKWMVKGKLKYVEGIKPFLTKRFEDYNRDSGNIWWDGLSGSWQNAVAAPHPDQFRVCTVGTIKFF